MAQEPHTEPGSQPVFPSTTTRRNLKDMGISELVSILRTSYHMDDFDRVEDELVTRDAIPKAEIGPLLEKFEVERLMRIQAEQELKKSEELCERGKRAQTSYEMLKQVKRNCLLDVDVDGNTIGELRSKNLELERENCELKQKLVQESNAVAELRSKVHVLEDEKVTDSDALAVLRNENCKLVDDKCRLEALVNSLEGKILRLEDDTKLLKSVETEADRGNYTGDPSPLQGNEDTHHSLGAATVKSRRKKNNNVPSELARGWIFLEMLREMPVFFIPLNPLESNINPKRMSSVLLSECVGEDITLLAWVHICTKMFSSKRQKTKKEPTKSSFEGRACSTTIVEKIDEILHFTNPREVERYEQMRNYLFWPARHIEATLLEKFNLTLPFTHYLARIGWERVSRIRHPVYREPTIEFLATFSVIHGNDQTPVHVSFQLNGRRYMMSLAEFNIGLDFETKESVQTLEYKNALQAKSCDFSDTQFWTELTGGGSQYNSRQSKSSSIRDPILRLMHRWIAHTIMARKESTGVVTRQDIFLLWCMVHGHRCNAGRFLLAHCESTRQATKSMNRRFIAIGTFISQLAANLGALHPCAHRVADMDRIDHTTLRGMHVIHEVTPGCWALNITVGLENVAGVDAHNPHVKL
ncbi:hypothetical protein RJT34_10778 [Clitoria ternatea]|uniref:Arabidopsis retrotransposon Orf1 C-terminal domain-containing protein n=1 Tax=Clitoria ternatea TaxID=43366 RepID=A0AAN9JL60_CLITE